MDDSIVWRLLTVVICSSPVPSNPDTRTLHGVFTSLAIVPALTRCAKVIQLDGAQPALPAARVRAYGEFARRVRALSATDPAFAHSQVYASDSFLFAAHNLAAAISRVNTTFLLSLQHDYQIARPFDVANLLRTMLTVPVVRHVRINMRGNAPARGFDGVVANATLRGLLVPLTRTCGWSDAPHFAAVEYYQRLVIPANVADHNGGRRKFMEESMHYRMQRNFRPGGCWDTKQQARRGVRQPAWPRDFDDYGTYLYGVASPRDGSYVTHRSLRGSEPQWGLNHDPKGDRGKGGRGRGGRGRGRGGRERRGGGGGGAAQQRPEQHSSRATAVAASRRKLRRRGRGGEYPVNR